MHTGENDQGLRKVLDMSRMISLLMLGANFYFYCYRAFQQWKLTSVLSDRLLKNVAATGLFLHPSTSRMLALVFLFISLLGVRGKKEERLSWKAGVSYISAGASLYLTSGWVLQLPFGITARAWAYMTLSTTGYLLVMTGGTLLTKVLRIPPDDNDVFNTENESFPQEERLLENEFSINLPAVYTYRGKSHRSWINIVNPFRSLLVMGTPGSGKSHFVIRHVISQHLSKGFSMFIYDFKFDDLSLIAWNHFLKNRHRYGVMPSFYVIDFEDLSRSHRCNPLDPEKMLDISDASESARTILFGLSREWIRRQGEFFVESPVNFLAAVIWFLRRHQDGRFCTLPHAIELMQVAYDRLFTLLKNEKEIEVLINPFVSAYLNGAMEQLEGQVASAKVAMARLSSPRLYYVLSGNDFTLDINDPESPKIVCMGNHPQKLQVYGAVVSLYVSRLIKLVNKKGKLKSSLVFDEFPTIYVNHMDALLATARGNRVATTLGVQDLSQLRKDYGRDQADVILNIAGNIVSGQVGGETARYLSERFGRTLQARTSFSVNSSDTSVNHSKHLEVALPASRISALSSGSFVGIVADNPDEKIPLKAFHCDIVNDEEALKKEARSYRPLPIVRSVTPAAVEENYLRIKQEVEDLVTAEMERLLNDPATEGLVLKKR